MPNDRAATVPTSHLLLALAVVAVWGSNFVVIKLTLDSMPPLLFALLRFCFAFLPAAVFIARPKVPLRRLAAYGVLIGAGQFGLLYFAVAGHISPGLASLVVQMQVFFTVALAVVFDGERVRPYQALAMCVAASGMVVIGVHLDAHTTLLGLALVLTAALCWAGGNQVARANGRVDVLAVVVWSSVFALPPLLAMTLLFEGPDAIGVALTSAGPSVWTAVLWQALGNTLFGYAAWSWLLARHPAASIAPMALLVPVFGMSTSLWWLGEALPTWKLLAGALVLVGLALNLFWPALAARFSRPPKFG